MAVRLERKPRLDRVLKKVKSICHLNPTGSSVVSTHGPLGILVAPAMTQMGHGPGSGASFFD